jgi:hypothetical protein
MSNQQTSSEADKFREFAKKLVAVPKKEIDEQLKKEHAQKEETKRKKRK